MATLARRDKQANKQTLKTKKTKRGSLTDRNTAAPRLPGLGKALRSDQGGEDKVDYGNGRDQLA